MERYPDTPARKFQSGYNEPIQPPDMSRSKKPSTILTHAGNSPSANHGIVNPPVYHVSTILFDDLETLNKAGEQTLDPTPDSYDYGRIATPTSVAFETAISELEGAFGTVTAPSGLGAITTALLSFVEAGDHVLIVDTTYSPTRRFSTIMLKRLGVEAEFYDPHLGADIASLFRPNTRLLFMESPGSLTFEMQDVPAMAAAAREAGVISMVDNTWASPLYCQPIALGVDVSIQAVTKYISGHSDVMMGTVSIADEALYKKVKWTAVVLGSAAGPDDHYLALRGLRTMGVRLAQHQQNALTIARWLQERPEVDRVLYPALPSHPGHEIWARDFSGASGLLSFLLKPADDSAFAALVDGLELFPLGASWGGYESLASPGDPAKLRTATSWNEAGRLLRLHIGLEDIQDLMADLEAGLDRFSAAAKDA